MSDPFSVPCVATPAVKMNSGSTGVKRVRSRELRGSKLFYTCRCNTRNGLQMDCPLAECQIACSKDRSKCPHRPTPHAAAGDYKRSSDNTAASIYQQMQQDSQVITQPQVENSQESSDPFGVQEGFLQDGQTMVQMKDGSPMNLSDADVAYIDYGYQMTPQGQKQTGNQTGAATMRPTSQKSSKSSVSGSQKASSATPMTAGWPSAPMHPYMMSPYMMQPGQFAYPQQMGYGMPMVPGVAMPAGVRPSTSSSSAGQGTEACQPQLMMPPTPMGQPGGYGPMYGMMPPCYYPGMGQQTSWPSYPLAEVDASAMQPEAVTQQQQIECGKIEEEK